MMNNEVCAILNRIGELLEITGENPFKYRTYFHAAQTIQALDTNLSELIAQGKLSALKGIGSALTKKITELVESGRLGYYEKLQQAVPPGLFEIAALPGLDRNKTGLLYLKLGITTPEELAAACEQNHVSAVRGLKQVDQAELLKAIRQRKKE
jgi:DNA polymerase (family X)